MIEVVDLTKKYDDFTAVAGISFSAGKGDLVGFLGPNGAGKTTTIRMLTTFLPPTSGEAHIAGFDIAKDGLEVRKKIGYLPETPPLYGDMTVREYLMFAARIRGRSESRVKGDVDSVLEKCAITKTADLLCCSLSKGFRQRVGIAQAIVHDPEVIILDEPTVGLDPQQIVELRKLIASLAEHKTVLISTHILSEVTMLCNQVVIMNEGQVVQQGSLNDLTADKTLEEVFMDCIR